MTPLEFVLVTFVTSIAAGVLGSMLGLGGGVIVVPVLTLVLGIPISLAVGASIISVIATSSGAAAAYVKDRMSNIRVGTFLQVTASLGAVTGGYLAGVIPTRALFVIFGLVLGYSAIAVFRKRSSLVQEDVAPDALADHLRLHGSYYDEAAGKEVSYKVTGSRIGLALMYVAGTVSGLLGVGAGVLKVPAMDLAMHLPIKVSTATSNFMIGVTAASSAGIYFFRGDINPFVAGPVALGVLVGSFVGSRLLGRVHSSRIRVAFVIVLVWVSVQMLVKGLS
jgi:uncharacterized membrane protein YfcA